MTDDAPPLGPKEYWEIVRSWINGVPLPQEEKKEEVKACSHAWEYYQGFNKNEYVCTICNKRQDKPYDTAATSSYAGDGDDWI